MIKRIKNKDSIAHVWCGMTVQPNEYYTIDATEYVKYATNDQVIADISNNIAQINDGTNDIIGINAQIDFLKGLSPTDTDGSPLSRLKIAPAGWTFQDHSFEFTLSKINSIYSKKADGSDFNFVTMKFFEGAIGAEVEITGANLNQTYLDTNCTKTIVDWEPTHDYDVIGGEVMIGSSINQDVRLWVVAVPDVPAGMGGSKELITGGQNLKNKTEIALDGRVVKHMIYNSTYHTNKIRMIFRHPIGFQATLEGCIDFYKA